MKVPGDPLGGATVVAGALVVLDMLGAFLLVHVGNGVFVTDGGFELVSGVAAKSRGRAPHGH